MTKTDYFHRYGPGDPGTGSATVTPNDTTDLPRVARSLVVLSAGAVVFTGVDGVDDTWTFTGSHAFPAVIPVAVTRVKSTGTTVTAGGIKAVW